MILLRHWRLLAKLALTTALLAIVFWRVDLAAWSDAIWKSLSVWLLAACAVNALLILTSVRKWEVLLQGLGIPTRRWILLKTYMIGFFMNACLPGVVGGDVLRCQLAGAATEGRMNAAATILIERVAGVAALVAMSLAAVAMAPATFATPPVLVLCVGMTVALVASVVIALNRRLADGVMYRTRRSRLARPARLVYRLHRTIRAVPRSAVLASLCWSAVFYVLSGVTLYCICRAFAVQITVVEAISIQLLVCLLILIPISIGGLGLTQAGDVYLFGLLGVAPEVALGVSIVRLVIHYGYVLLGGVFFVAWRSEPAVRAGASLARNEPV